jgi:hypothetical protein
MATTTAATTTFITRGTAPASCEVAAATTTAAATTIPAGAADVSAAVRSRLLTCAAGSGCVRRTRLTPEPRTPASLRREAVRAGQRARASIATVGLGTAGATTATAGADKGPIGQTSAADAHVGRSAATTAAGALTRATCSSVAYSTLPPGGGDVGPDLSHPADVDLH